MCSVRELRWRALGPGLVLGLGLGLGLAGGACQLPNPDHCFNISSQPNRWCAEASMNADGEVLRPFCSPCAAENQGCVSEEPDPEDCPLYTTPAPATETQTEPETDTGEAGARASSGANFY